MSIGRPKMWEGVVGANDYGGYWARFVPQEAPKARYLCNWRDCTVCGQAGWTHTPPAWPGDTGSPKECNGTFVPPAEPMSFGHLWGNLSMMGFVVALPLRIAWDHWPVFWLCLLFWAIELHPRCVTVRRGRFRHCAAVSYVGAWCNALATLANGGRMPVLDYTGTGTGVHVALNAESRLVFLADVFHMGHGWATASIGDFLIIGGLLCALALWVCQKAGLYALPVGGPARRARVSVGFM